MKEKKKKDGRYTSLYLLIKILSVISKELMGDARIIV
jgi:hypothetical protein